MPPSKFEANQMFRLRVKCTFFSFFPLASSCLNAYFRAYAIIDFLADRLVFLNNVTFYLPLLLDLSFSKTSSTLISPFLLSFFHFCFTIFIIT